MRFVSTVSALALITCGTVLGAADWAPTYGLYGVPGIIETPTAVPAPDGRFSTVVSGFDTRQSVTIGFQISPRLTGAFRYSHVDDYFGLGAKDLFDRSFDLQYQLNDEGDLLPAFAVGLRDFMGTGVLSSEYVVGTKTIGDDLRVSAGLGWGRLGTLNGFANPLATLVPGMGERPPHNYGKGGIPSLDQYFRGDAALFGGVEWRVSPKWTVLAEYDSDAYVRETGVGTANHKTPYNLGVVYSPAPGYELSAYALWGSNIGVTATAYFDPKLRPAVSGFDPAPIPVRVRSEDARAATSWNRAALPDMVLRLALVQVLGPEGIEVDSAAFTDTSVHLRYTNTRYRTEVQALGRVARILSQAMPDSIETFVLEPMQRGIPLSRVTIKRSDLEDLENHVGAVEEIYTRSEVQAGAPAPDLQTVENPGKKDFTWGILPYYEITLFDPRNPAIFDVGLELKGDYTLRPNLHVTGAVRGRLFDTGITAEAPPPSSVPIVRSNTNLFSINPVSVDRLQVAGYGHPTENLYTRVSAGYLEQMYGGLSAELLWKPVDSAFALGAEVNYVQQRDPETLVGFGDYSTVTGHLSAYYKADNGFHYEVNAGRYLAGDWGATVKVDREFDNGWRVGAYATFTDIPFDAYGEGSFDKGIRVSIPMDWASGQITRQTISADLRSLTRDGGSQLDIEGRLYDVVRPGHVADYYSSWGRFWR